MAAGRLQRLLGQIAASVISRVMGMVLATVAVDAVLGGLQTRGVLDLSAAG